MSFFFSPIPSHFQNYCLLVPILPYFMAFEGGREQSQSYETQITEAKAQELDQNLIEYQNTLKESQKLSQSQTEFPALKIQEEMLIQSKKPTAALQSQYIQVQNTHSPKDHTLREVSDNGIRNCRKSENRVQKTIKIKINKFVKEEEYKPFEKKRKPSTTVRDNQNRNIIPNEVNQIFSYIQKSSKSQYALNRIFKKYPPPSNQNFTIKKFYLYQSLLKEKISNYINESSLSMVTELYEPRCEVYSEQQQRYYNKVCRMLIHHFLQQDSIFNILTSRRMHKDKKRNHLEMRRVLKSKVIEILRH